MTKTKTKKQPSTLVKVKGITIPLYDAMKVVTKKLKRDKQWYYAFQANIAMAYMDNERWYKEKTGKKTLNREDKHKIANNAAKYFLDLLCKN